MRISEMILREDFYGILKDTIENYFSETTGKKITLSYDNGEGKRLIINSRLGFISGFPAPKGLRTFLLGEYNVRGNAFKYLAGKLAALGVSAFPQIGKARYCFITPDVLNGNSFIYPQNRSVRIFNYEKNHVDCIIKSGFTNKYFSNQLAFRKEHDYGFMIPLLEYGNNWFREPILYGHPLARTTSDSKYRKGVSDALEGIKHLSSDTYEEFNSDDYMENLISEIERKLYDAENKKCIQTKQTVIKMVKKAAAQIIKNCKIPVSMSHGDLQAGNIWIDKSGKTLIYDWETAGIRSVWYDPAVLTYSLRRANGWNVFVKESDICGLLTSDKQRSYRTDETCMIKGVILLEDILFYLDDMLELPDKWGAEIFDNNMKNIGQAVL